MDSDARLQAVLDLSRTLSSSLDLHQVLEEAAGRAVELTGAHRASIIRWRRDRRTVAALIDYLPRTDGARDGNGDEYPLAAQPTTQRLLDRMEPVGLSS